MGCMRMVGIPRLWLELQVDIHGHIFLKGLFLSLRIVVLGWVGNVET